MIRMVNQTGDGFADAYSEHEALAYIAKGWSKFVAQEVKAQEPEAEPIAEVQEVAPRKRGRPAKAE